MSDVLISIDGEILPPERAMISVLDRGLLYGDGVFEVLRTWGGVAVDLDAHLQRLGEAASALVLRMRRGSELAGFLRDALAAAPTDRDHRIRIVVTRGPGHLRAPLASLGPGRTIIILEPLPAPPAGIALAIVDAPLPEGGRGRKTLAYLDHLLARHLACGQGADDAIRLDARGDVAECATANLFAVLGATVVTPSTDTGALPGVVRARVLAACARLGIAAAARRLTVAELRAASEIFVTSSLRGVAAVTRLDDEPRVAGPVTARLASEYVAEMTSLSEAFRHRD